MINQKDSAHAAWETSQVPAIHILYHDEDADDDDDDDDEEEEEEVQDDDEAFRFLAHMSKNSDSDTDIQPCLCLGRNCDEHQMCKSRLQTLSYL